jgi:predicted homoserine dehydrogenase-like protein
MITTAMLRELADKGLRVGLIGAGKFGTMFLSQARRVPGLHVVGVADLNVARARESLARADWPAEQYAATTLFEARARGTTYVGDDALALIAGGIDVIVDATGHPQAGARHALAALNAGVHMVLPNVESDVLVGPLLAERFAKAGLAYSMAYGDQPALIVELVDWARAAGFPVVCAGKGTKYLPQYHHSTPDTVWDYFGFTAEQLAVGDFNPKMFNSFIDGTKASIEMAAVANATGLAPQAGGLRFPPCGTDDLQTVLRPVSVGGQLDRAGTVEVVSSLERDGSRVPRDIQVGVFVVFQAPNDYAARCFGEYGLRTDPTGRYTALYRPYHLIGLELGISVILAGLRGEATGQTRAFVGDVVAVAKRDLQVGETLDGEGGYCVYGRLMPAADSLRAQALPIGLAHNVMLQRPVAQGQVLSWNDVAYDATDTTVMLRKEMERRFAK